MIHFDLGTFFCSSVTFSSFKRINEILAIEREISDSKYHRKRMEFQAKKGPRPVMSLMQLIRLSTNLNSPMQ
jgi:hypothetical protein